MGGGDPGAVTGPNMEASDRPPPSPLRNRYNIGEWAGAFGDLGTLIPFAAGYITIMKMDPLGVLFMFGVLLIASGLYYRTPIPIQPMKAIGGAAITHAAQITPAMVMGAGLFTGLFWLVMGLTNSLNLISRVASKPVVRGIVLGLGLSFITEGLRMIRTDLPVGIAGLILTFLLLSRDKIPAMFALLIFGVATALIRDPGLAFALIEVRPEFRTPTFEAANLKWADVVSGTVILGIPQIPLTLGNAVIAITAENNRLFPDRPVTEKKIAISQGILNLISPLFGGIPMCHGAGGMAGHVRFGAKTGGALVILGVILLIGGLFFSGSIALLFKILPECVLGVILFFAGLELAVSVRDLGNDKNDYYVLLVTAGFALWNMGVAFLAGVIMQELLKRKILKF